MYTNTTVLEFFEFQETYTKFSKKTFFYLSDIYV
jgi:hypothetical protein